MSVQLVLLVVAYFLGSIPTGYIAGRLAGLDIRTLGSGSTGATNVWRCIGKGAGITVFTIDLLKGVLAVLAMQYGDRTGLYVPEPAFQEWFAVGAAMFALLGHSRSIWLGFGGGKSVATGLGVLLALNCIVALSALGVWAIAMGIWRIVSLSSILAAIAAPILMVSTQSPLAYSIFAVIGGTFVIWRHRSNIERLLQGQEQSIFQANESD